MVRLNTIADFELIRWRKVSPCGVSSDRRVSYFKVFGDTQGFSGHRCMGSREALFIRWNLSDRCRRYPKHHRLSPCFLSLQLPSLRPDQHRGDPFTFPHQRISNTYHCNLNPVNGKNFNSDEGCVRERYYRFRRHSSRRTAFARGQRKRLSVEVLRMISCIDAVIF